MATVSNWLRSWRLVSWRSALVAAVVLYALIGFFVVPWVVKGQIETRSLEMLKRQATVEKVRCNPFALSLTIEGFSLPDRPGSVLLSWDRLYANAQISSLFRWAATLKELRIENPYVALRRFEDGAVNVLEVMGDLPASEAEPTDQGGLPRVLLQHVQVVDARVDLEDSYNRPDPLLWDIGPNQVELSEICTIPQREGSNDIELLLPDGGRVTVTGKVVVQPLGLDGTFTIENNPLASMWRAVAHMFEFDLTSGIVDLELDYRVGLEEDGPHVVVDDADIHITDFGFKSDLHDEELLQVDDIRITRAHLEWPEQNITGDSVVITGATAFAWVAPDGTPSWNVLVPEESQEQIVEVYQTLEERISATAQLGRFELRNAGAQFEDATSSPPVRFEVKGVNLVITDITTEEGSTWPVEASTTLEGEAQASAMGTVGVSPIDAEVEVALEGLDLSKYRGYVARFAPLDLRAGVLSVNGTAKAAKPKGEEPFSASYEGGFNVTGLNLNETVTNGKLLGWGDLSVDGITANLEPLGAQVTDIDLSTAGLEITVAEDGTINLLEFFKALSEGDDGEPASAGPGEGGGLPPVQIARFRLHDCYGLYTDKTVLGEPFTLEIRPVDGTISAISTTSASPATLDIDAGIASGGAVRVGGDLDIFDYTRLTDLSIDLRDVELPAMSPMSVKFIGHPITGGDVALDLDYEIVDRYLTASNHIEADDLQLGDKVEDQGLVNLPFKLGVSLLKDKEGRITLDIPFEGSFDTPGFGMASAAGSAAKEIFTELVKSPFKLLGKLGGGGGEQDLEHVEFVAGSATLDERQADKLATLASGLAERPALGLGIVGVVDPEADATALRVEAYEAVLLADGVTREELDTVIPLDKLEDGYRRMVTDPTLEALRARHTSSADGEATEGQLDEMAYRREMRDALVAVQPVDAAAVEALGPARAEAIRRALVVSGGIDPARVSVLG
ncbi:MAG: DUF748 domain-containing protein, partial [Holophagae bacterium]